MHEDKTIVVHGTIGDVNALDYGGGIVYEVREDGELFSQLRLAYFEPVDENDEESDVMVYRCDVPDNVMEEFDWVKRPDVSKTCDVPCDEMTEQSTSANIMARARLIETISMHWDWREIDDYPERYTREEVEDLYGQILDAPEGVPFTVTKEERR